MKFREKLPMQIFACCLIFSVVKVSQYVDVPWVQDLRAKVSERVTRSYTDEEIAEAGRYVWDVVKDIPAAVNAVVQKANYPEVFKSPLRQGDGDVDEKGLKPVYAVDGGVVHSVGFDRDKRYYVKIGSGEKMKVYGNLAGIDVITRERVFSGEVIGYFDTKGSGELIFGGGEALDAAGVKAVLDSAGDAITLENAGDGAVLQAAAEAAGAEGT